MEEKQWGSLGLNAEEIKMIKYNSLLSKPGSNFTVEEVFIEAIKRYNAQKKIDKTLADFKT